MPYRGHSSFQARIIFTCDMRLSFLYLYARHFPLACGDIICRPYTIEDKQSTIVTADLLLARLSTPPPLSREAVSSLATCCTWMKKMPVCFHSGLNDNAGS